MAQRAHHLLGRGCGVRNGGATHTPTRRLPPLLRSQTVPRAHEDREAGPPRPPALHLSFFVPYKSLPPDGQVIPPEEEACDIQVQRCKTNAYVFETPCDACHGTGHARARHPARGSRSRASLHTCLVCVGMGHVRRTTARTPLVRTLHHADDPAGGAATTLARTQRLPGEPTQQHAAHDGHSHHQQHNSAGQRQPRQPQGLLKKAIELNEQRNKAAAEAAATAAAAAGAVPQNNIVSGAGLAGAAKKQQQQQQQQKASGTPV